MTGTFWLGLAYGLCLGLLFWCKDVFMKEWRNATQPPAAQ